MTDKDQSHKFGAEQNNRDVEILWLHHAHDKGEVYIQGELVVNSGTNKVLTRYHFGLT
jgi:hypothetical protein